MRLLLTALFLPLTLLAAEPSAFGAGNLDSDNPYGLTSSEKTILKNKQLLADVKKKSMATEGQLGSLLERLDGMQTIVEGISEKAHTNKMELGRLQEGYRNDQETLQNDLAALNERSRRTDELIKANEQNIMQLKTVLDEFSKMIDSINTNYVSKDEYNALVKDVNDFKQLVSKELKSIASTSKGSALDNMSSADVATKAKALYDKKQYTEAIEYYEHLIKKKYKPARANYMIGEMFYYRKDYGKAIAYFKESARLYDKASYMPILMLHTAVAMEKTGDRSNAETFLNAIIAKYPESKYAVDAQERLDKLQ